MNPGWASLFDQNTNLNISTSGAHWFTKILSKSVIYGYKPSGLSSLCIQNLSSKPLQRRRERLIMERLIYSSPIPSRYHLKSFPLVPRLGGAEPGKLGLSSSACLEFGRLNSFFLKHEEPSPSFTLGTKFPRRCSCKSSFSPVGAPDNSISKPYLLKRIAGSASEQKKVLFEELLLWIKRSISCFIQTN